MASYPKSIRLRGGELLSLRPTEASDEHALCHFFTHQVPEADRRYLKEDVTDAAVIRRWLGALDLARVFPLLAWAGDQIVGDATLHVNPYGWSPHVGEIRVVVAEAWQRKGIAQALVGELVSCAHDRGLEILEAHVLEGQHGAQRAFETLGFHAETVLLRRAVDRTGRRRNIIVMTNDVSELWRKMEELVRELDEGHSDRY